MDMIMYEQYKPERFNPLQAELAVKRAKRMHMFKEQTELTRELLRLDIEIKEIEGKLGRRGK